MRAVLVLLCFLPGVLWAQVDDDSESTVHLLHREKRTERFLDTGIKVTVRFNDYSRMKGILEAAEGDSLRISGQNYSVYDIHFIGHRKFWTKVGGIALLGTGVGLLAYGVVDIGNSNLFTSLLYGGLGTGVGFMGAGLLRDGKRYYLDRDWKVIP